MTIPDQIIRRITHGFVTECISCNEDPYCPECVMEPPEPKPCTRCKRNQRPPLTCNDHEFGYPEDGDE